MKFMLICAAAAASPFMASAMRPRSTTDEAMYPYDPLPVDSDYYCECGQPCRSPDGSTGTCGSDFTTCANFLVAPVCPEQVAESTSSPLPRPHDRVWTTSSLARPTDRDIVRDTTSSSGWFGPSSSSIIDDFFTWASSSSSSSSSMADTEYRCECGQPCHMAGGSQGTCGADGTTCAMFLVPPDCSAPVTRRPRSTSFPLDSTTSGSDAECPDGCSGVPSRMMNYLCDDGSVAGPVCEEPACEWTIRSCPESTTGGYTTSAMDATADWCPAVSRSCQDGCEFECLPEKQCAMPATTDLAEGACTCDMDYTCVAIGSVGSSSSCSDIECEGRTCQTYLQKGMDPVKEMGCEQCSECVAPACSWWACDEIMTTEFPQLILD